MSVSEYFHDFVWCSEQVIERRKMISRVRNVLENQSPRKTIRHRTTKPQEVITLQTDTRHFEAFLRSIGRCDSLLDARRLKNDISGEIRRTRALLGMVSELYFIVLLTIIQPNIPMKIGSMARKLRMLWLSSIGCIQLRERWRIGS